MDENLLNGERNKEREIKSNIGKGKEEETCRGFDERSYLAHERNRRNKPMAW
jgi:hypothetical protein